MVYKTQSYWVSGSCPSSGILKFIKHNLPEIGFFSVLDEGRKTTTLLGLYEFPNLSHGNWYFLFVREQSRIGFSIPSLEDGNRFDFRNFLFIEFTIPDHGQSPECQWFWELERDGRIIFRTITKTCLRDTILEKLVVAQIIEMGFHHKTVKDLKL
jgi:hypothetical protein